MHGAFYGYSTHRALRYVQFHGICTENDYSYKGYKEYGNPHKPPRYNIIKSHEYLFPEDNEKIPGAIAEHPIIGIIKCSKSYDEFKGKGVCKMPSEVEVVTNTNEPDEYHALLVTGYGVEDEHEYYEVLNYAGPLWGNRGSGKIEKKMLDFAISLLTAGGRRCILPVAFVNIEVCNVTLSPLEDEDEYYEVLNSIGPMWGIKEVVRSRKKCFLNFAISLLTSGGRRCILPVAFANIKVCIITLSPLECLCNYFPKVTLDPIYLQFYCFRICY